MDSTQCSDSSSKIHYNPKFPTVLLNLKEMREKGLNTDVKIICEGKEFNAHQLILSAGSSVFKLMFQNNFKESVVKSIDLSYSDENTVSAVLDYLYVPSSEVLTRKTFDELLKLQEIAHYLDMQELIKSVNAFLLDRMNVSNCLDLCEKFLLYDCKSELELVFNFVAKHLAEVVRSEMFMEMNDSSMKEFIEILHRRDVSMDSEILLDALVQWCERHDGRRRLIFLEMLFHFNFEFVSKEYVDRLLQRKSSLFADALIAKYFEHQVKPHLKWERDIRERGNELSVTRLRVRRYLGNCCAFRLREEYILRLVDVLENDLAETFKLSPLTIPLRIVAIRQWKTILWFLVDHLTSPRQFLVGYDLKAMSVIAKSLFPSPLIVTGFCVSADVIHIIGSGVNDEMSDEEPVYVHAFTLSTQTWKNFQTLRPQRIIACVNVSDTLYILCQETYYFYKILKKDDTCISETRKHHAILPPAPELYFLEDLIVTLQDRIICFVHRDDCILDLYSYDVSQDSWHKQSIIYEDDQLLHSYSIPGKGFLFKNSAGRLVHFDTDMQESKHLSIRILSTENYKYFDTMNEAIVITSRVILTGVSMY